MTLKLGRQFFYILTLCSFLWNQQTAYLTQKIAIENSYRDKVISAVSRILGQEKFIVIVNVEFSTVGGILKKTASPQSGEIPANGYTPIPGLPTVPTGSGSLSNSKSGRKPMGENNYSISRVEINIGLDKELATGTIKQEIISLVKKVIPETRECQDCIKIEALQFLPSEKSKKLDELEKAIAALEAEKRKADLEADALHLQNLEEQLAEAKAARIESESFLRKRELEQMERETIRFEKLIESERDRKKQDSIRFVNTEQRLEKVMESKLRSDSLIISEAMDMYKSIMKKKGGNDFDNEALLGMQIGNSGPGILNAVIFLILVICLIILSYFAFNKKPKTIYLKPKDNEKISGKEKVDKKDSNGIKADEGGDAPSPKAPTLTPAPKQDEDAIRSELKSMRQTAVSMTIGEKESASALIKEWLADNPNKEEVPAEAESGE